ncbi:hypothetical protein SmuNN2025_1071 [Streptococcus mutans NN2025]|uniref:Uncharacterized protein n=1 Tax=Streptococcus mutans serotype c (strain ATCC 700610 / UA159) TaxID=210007 RepID=Q8DUH1_STRMU|nr:hypothetical protein SMU_958 [Streptococcus mutans UA159]BAH88097.1 hypothetical protein SmuNN2025_1071 [Streptococcus mutans NN2025]
MISLLDHQLLHFQMKMLWHQLKLLTILLKMLKHLKSKAVQSKVLFLQKKKFKLSQHFQTEKDFFLCSCLYFKRQSATLHMLSKLLQKAKTKTPLKSSNSSIVLQII